MAAKVLVRTETSKGNKWTDLGLEVIETLHKNWVPFRILNQTTSGVDWTKKPWSALTKYASQTLFPEDQCINICVGSPRMVDRMHSNFFKKNVAVVDLPVEETDIQYLKKFDEVWLNSWNKLHKLSSKVRFECSFSCGAPGYILDYLRNAGVKVDESWL